ncbi:hypothetical protein Tco_0117281 [Tanacetum coccineum]
MRVAVRLTKYVHDFVPIGSAKEEELIKKMNEKATDEDTSNKEKVLKEPDSPDEEGIIDYEVMEKWFPIINWESKFYDFDRHGAECIYYRIFRSDGSSRWIKTFLNGEKGTMYDANGSMNYGRSRKDGILKAGIYMKIVVLHPFDTADGTGDSYAYRKEVSSHKKKS